MSLDYGLGTMTTTTLFHERTCLSIYFSIIILYTVILRVQDL